VRGWWQRLKDRVAGWFRRPPRPGRFESGSAFSIHGYVPSAPLVWPSRDYVVYEPANRPRWKRAPLVVLLHGCKQSPEVIARGTRIAALADREGCVVLLPSQKDSANPWRCWNWFDSRTVQGNGEAAIVAAQIHAVQRRHRIDRKRVYVAGMSAGGALAAVLGIRHPGLICAVAVHSGLACGAARSGLSARSVMKNGPEVDVVAIASGAAPASMPLLVIHGGKDDVVAPFNAAALVHQFLARNGDDPARPPDAERRVDHGNGRAEVVREWRRDGRLVVRYVEVEGLGHAWCGGEAGLAFNDPGPPDATALMGAFFASTQERVADRGD
jgi:poly(hydroxyalkanoate) depolymerase family esterase